MERWSKPNSTGYEAHGIGKKEIKFKKPLADEGPRVSAEVRGRSATKKPGTADRQAQFAICVCNDDYPASLELRKLYQVVEDDFAQQHALLRVIDESGEDYLYPGAYFVRVALPKPVEHTLHRIG